MYRTFDRFPVRADVRVGRCLLIHIVNELFKPIDFFKSVPRGTFSDFFKSVPLWFFVWVACFVSSL